VDFPTLGNPTRPTSARSLSSKKTSSASPGCPGFANLGICLVEDANLAFPFPPLPPFAMILGSSEEISAISLPVAASLTSVPLGTFITRSSPLLPVQFLLPPDCPSSAQYFFLYLKSTSVERLSSQTKTTSPPLPPSPPSGPPAAIYFSLWKETAPSPPFPALILIFALSTNITNTPLLYFLQKHLF